VCVCVYVYVFVWVTRLLQFALFHFEVVIALFGLSLAFIGVSESAAVSARKHASADASDANATASTSSAFSQLLTLAAQAQPVTTQTQPHAERVWTAAVLHRSVSELTAALISLASFVASTVQIPGEGMHSLRVGGFAVLDVVGTIWLAALCAGAMSSSFWAWNLVWFTLAEVVHAWLRIDSTVIRLIKSMLASWATASAGTGKEL